MTPKYRARDAGACLATLAVFLLSGCASMTSSKEELQVVGDTEGIVVGSVLLTVAQGDANESALAFLGGRKAGEVEYAVEVTKTGFDLLKTTYTLPATPGKEEFFVKKLPAGYYAMNSIRPTGFLSPNALRFSIGLSFAVKPNEVTYIGRLLVTFPDRIRGGSRYSYAIQDAQRETTERLRNDYPSIVPRAVRNLAGRYEGPSIVPGDTSASALLQRDTVNMIILLDGVEDKACSKRAVVNTESIRKPTRPTDTGEERWTLDRCGTLVRYMITFMPSARGGTDISARKE